MRKYKKFRDDSNFNNKWYHGFDIDALVSVLKSFLPERYEKLLDIAQHGKMIGFGPSTHEDAEAVESSNHPWNEEADRLAKRGCAGRSHYGPVEAD